ncbi:alpha-protein kinase 3 [Festucalex cinctus]
MGSRRTMSRSQSANGRSGNGITGNSRPGGCSYISNVRPENRSTLCSVIAQLTQETQPAFVTTLKSKAVSESCNVKFFCVVTGYPIPQLTWYKDDKQLDRFCGLPKYEIFRNGQTHSLHIYNCTVEDAAIYQVSASNNKGIVSCSGVLEVGGMNEFKIHQRYFAMLKQKREGRGKETDGKENQEPIRTISPERSQRKRRSTMETFPSTPNSMEDEVTEELNRSVCEVSKVEPAEEPVEENPAHLTKTCVKTNNENGIMSGVDKTPFVKKKIKICPKGERTPEEMREANSEELMEVESCRNIAERQNRAPYGKLLRSKSSEALRSPEGARKDKESVFKREEKVSEKNPRTPSRLQNAPQQLSGRHVPHAADPGSVDVIHQNRNALPEKTSNQPPQKETKAKQRNPSTQSEVTQAPTWMSGNNAPVNPEPPPDRRLAAADARPQRKTPPNGAATTEDARRHLVTPGVKSPQHRQHHSKGFRESHTVPQKSQPLTFANQQSQADLVVKCVAGIEGQGYKKVDANDVNRLVAPKEKNVKVVTDTTASPKIQQPNNKVAKVTNSMLVSNKDNKVSTLKSNSELQSDKQTKVETAGADKKTPSLHEQQSKDVQEITKPVTRVVSVAELMRAQIRALDSAVTSPAKDITSDLVTHPTAADKYQNLRIDKGKYIDHGIKTEPHIIPNYSVNSTTPKQHAQKSHLGKDKISPKDPNVCPSSAVNSLSIQCHQDGTAFSNAGSSNNSCSDPVNPKAIVTQGRKAVPDSIPKNRVDRTSPKENLVKERNEDPSLCPSSVIDPLSIEVNQDVTDIPNAGSLKNYSSAPVKPKAVETQPRKSAPDSMPKTRVDRTSPKKNLVKEPNHDPNLQPSSAIDPLSIEVNQDVTDIPNAGSLKNYSSAPVKPKAVETQPRKSVPDSMPKTRVDRTSPKKNLVKEPNHDPNLQPSSVIDPLSIEINQDVTDIPNAGSLENISSVTVKPKEVETQPRKSAADSMPKTRVDRASPKKNLLKEPNHDPNLQPSSVIDPLSIEVTQDVTDIPNAGPLKNCSSVPVKPKEVETQQRKSVPDSIPNNSVDQTSPKEHLVKQIHSGKSRTFQEDPSPRPSSAVDLLSIECNQDVAAIPHANSSKTYPSIPINPKEEATQRPTSRIKSGQIQGKNMGLVENFIPDIKFDTEIQQGTTGNPSQTLFTEQSPASADTLENCLHIQGMIEDIQGSDFFPNPNTEASPLLQTGDCDSLPTPATPQELASGARRKILSSKDKPEETNLLPEHQPVKREVSPPDSMLNSSPVSIISSPDSSQHSPHLLQPSDDRSSLVEKRSPTLERKKPAVTKASSQLPNEDSQSEKTEDRWDPCKAPQVIRKIRSERFSDSSGHLKLWCQFFNVLTDSTITWYRNQLEIARIPKSAADESQVNLAVVQASSKDSGVYKCTITNDYGSDSTDFLLGPEILAGISLREDHGVGEEIEMAPLVFSKGVADSGIWGSKLFGRVMVHKSCIGEGCTHKVWRAKVIYGLEPVFESGHTCIIKAQRHIAYGGKEEHCLTDRNMDLVKQDCKIQNLAREYCKIFSAETRVIENFGTPLEFIPVYLMYRPANTIPYATVEADLAGVYQKYVVMDNTGRIEMRSSSEVGLKCCALQHWIFQWTNGNLLITRLEGVDTKITNIGITVKYTGHQGLQMEGKTQILEAFVSQHQCNYFCGLLGLRSLKLLDSLMAPAKPKGSRSPLLQRKSQAAGSCSPQAGRRAGGSPRTPRKAEQDAIKSLKAAVEVSL